MINCYFILWHAKKCDTINVLLQLANEIGMNEKIFIQQLLANLNIFFR